MVFGVGWNVIWFREIGVLFFNRDKIDEMFDVDRDKSELIGRGMLEFFMMFLFRNMGFF